MKEDLSTGLFGIGSPLRHSDIQHRVYVTIQKTSVSDDFVNRLRLTITAWRVNDGVEALVSDTGVDIPKENFSKIWAPLFTAGKKDGAGLGMAIVTQIVEDHGWRISVESEVGKGTTFTVRTG